ncbi:craniofacial development protein 2-like [Neoarius graeffei]|uniref:craniofacial development protein 2-like n=1 Tax=Neoarius graeffei TaxID=443677 RepID=UPI00298C77A0|nr:craniofacial development protein 2-like [Neoarius graeffei]
MGLSLPLRNGKTAKCLIVNVYGPTTKGTQENPFLVESLYDELSNAIKIPSRWLLFVCGDFNAKLGKLSKTDHDAGLNLCIGLYGMGKRNDNGKALASFISVHGLLTTNTAFKHPARHRTSWVGHIATPKRTADSKSTIAVFNQIDFVLCKLNCKPLLKDSRIYGGTDLNSDHKPVVTRIRMENAYLVHKQKREKGQVRYDLTRLTTDPTTQVQYREYLQNQVANAHYDNNPNKALDTLLKCMHISAANTLGVLKSNKHRQHTEDPQVAELSEKQKALRLCIYQTGKSKDQSVLRKERNTILQQINK